MTDDLNKARELAAMPARKRPVLLIADRKALAEMTARAEIHPWVSGYLGLYRQKAWWNPQACLIEAGEDLYAEKSASLREVDTPDDQLIERLGKALKFTIPLIRLTPAIADDVFTFDYLKPIENGKFYVLHPVRHSHYVLAADYPQRVLVETHSTFLKLAAALGAKSVKLTSVTAEESKKGGGFKAPIEEIKAVLGLKASVDESVSATYSHEKTFDKQSQAPHVPEDLKQWVESDTNLETMAHLRLKNGVTKDHVSISVARKAGVDAELLAKVGDKEASANATYHAASTSTWHFAVEYHPL
ncbi:TPA: hypothetical protein UM515_000245 [Stenotrophomonas maltophilia]|uniref:hypothetical protein n=1 Tax=Stenotrophomonas TaxID=40323 RepID=UPI0013D953E4|nr:MULTISPECIES: hypothetical protein [Stenotrophomonas]ELC7321893.1 hypothetical protein [Stenotrophomonas maltophilia]MBA0364310.1 hypothetical protein [Stenotrophomonas maltophilia]MBH1731987.1 hypothetical protein [Stenotrophomonas maltophilia]UXB41334.1 hypothetical protein K7569_05955 [Stenotrophomonas maltophilia]HEL3246757.1 hypothetical protein [Stenotrophomonas maltophilia]